MKRFGILCVVMLVGLLAGCTRAISEGAGVVMGPKGIFTPIDPPPHSDAMPLADYTNCELGPIRDDFGGRTPELLVEMLPGYFAQARMKLHLPHDPDGKTVVVRVTIMHYEDEKTLQSLISPLEEVVARVELLDKDSQKVLAVANCIGRSTSTTTKGVSKKTEGLATAIADWMSVLYRGNIKERTE